MKRVHCHKCGKLLLKAKSEYETNTNDFDLEVQCTRATCKTINRLKAK